MIEAGLRAYLLQQPAVAAIVGDRVYPIRLPQNATLPAITYQRIAGDGRITHDGDAGLGSARIQVDCWAGSYGEALALKAAVREALAGFRGSWDGTPVSAVTVVNDMDLPEPEPELWRRLVEISVLHGREAA